MINYTLTVIDTYLTVYPLPILVFLFAYFVICFYQYLVKIKVITHEKKTSKKCKL